MGELLSLEIPFDYLLEFRADFFSISTSSNVKILIVGGTRMEIR